MLHIVFIKGRISSQIVVTGVICNCADFCHCAGIQQKTGRTGQSGIFNLGSGKGYSVREIIDTARRITGREIPSVAQPRRAGDPAQLVASSEKAKTVLGWKPQYNDLNTIVSSAWAWHKSHPNGYAD
mgnify:CR=1 FL=1